MNRNKALENNINLVRKIAWSFHYSTGIEWDDLFGEACIGFLAAYDKYDSNKASLSTWMFYSIKNHLIDYCKKQNTKTTPLSFLEFEPVAEQEDPLFIEELIDGLSNNGQEVVNTILDAPSAFFLLPPKMARGKIRDHLREKGWKWQDIWDGMKEVDLILSKQ